MTHHPDQLGFGGLLEQADKDNAAQAFAKQTKHLPDTWSEALRLHRQQIQDHSAAMLACDFDTALRIRDDAGLLAKKLNGGDPGILADDDAPGCRLERACAADAGDVPLWGQQGTFEVIVCDVVCRIAFHSMFGICASAMPYLGFEARAKEGARRFISGTGYRSFLGYSIPPEPGLTPADFVECVITSYVEDQLSGTLVPVSR